MSSIVYSSKECIITETDIAKTSLVELQNVVRTTLEKLQEAEESFEKIRRATRKFHDGKMSLSDYNQFMIDATLPYE
jgi:hypothetical protein